MYLLKHGSSKLIFLSSCCRHILHHGSWPYPFLLFKEELSLLFIMYDSYCIQPALVQEVVNLPLLASSIILLTPYPNSLVGLYHLAPSFFIHFSNLMGDAQSGLQMIRFENELSLFLCFSKSYGRCFKFSSFYWIEKDELILVQAIGNIASCQVIKSEVLMGATSKLDLSVTFWMVF